MTTKPDATPPLGCPTPQPSQPLRDQARKSLTRPVTLITLTLIFSVSLWFLGGMSTTQAWFNPPISFGELNNLENTFAPISAFFTGISGIGLLITIYLQMQDARSQREETTANRAEGIFFDLLKMHRENADALRANDINLKKIVVRIKSRYKAHLSRKNQPSEKFKIYNHDDAPPNLTIANKLYPNGCEEHLQSAYYCCALYHEEYKNREEVLSSYYRHLYHTIRFVAEKVTNPDTIKLYMQIIRAQLDSYAQAMLLYNAHCYYLLNKKHDEEAAGKFKRFIEQHALLHEINADILPDPDHVNLYAPSARGLSDAPQPTPSAPDAQPPRVAETEAFLIMRLLHKIIRALDTNIPWLLRFQLFIIWSCIGVIAATAFIAYALYAPPTAAPSSTSPLYPGGPKLTIFLVELAIIATSALGACNIKYSRDTKPFDMTHLIYIVITFSFFHIIQSATVALPDSHITIQLIIFTILSLASILHALVSYHRLNWTSILFTYIMSFVLMITTYELDLKTFCFKSELSHILISSAIISIFPAFFKSSVNDIVHAIKQPTRSEKTSLLLFGLLVMAFVFFKYFTMNTEEGYTYSSALSAISGVLLYRMVYCSRFKGKAEEYANKSPTVSVTGLMTAMIASAVLPPPLQEASIYIKALYPLILLALGFIGSWLEDSTDTVIKKARN